jgi:MFS family permease
MASSFTMCTHSIELAPLRDSWRTFCAMSFITRIELFSPFRHAAFRSTWGAGTLSLMAYWMTEVASSWHMRVLTDADPLLVASVYTVMQLPILLILIPAGVITDLLDRRRVLIWTHVWLALTLGVLACLISYDLITPLLLLLYLPLISIGQAIRMPALSTLVPDLVSPLDIPAAVSLNSISQNAARILGPAIAGVLLGLTDVTAIFVLSALIMAVVVMMFLRLRYAAVNLDEALSWRRFITSIGEGIQFVASTTWARNILIRIGSFFACSAAVPALMAVRFKTAETYGLMYGCFGAGSMLGMFAIAFLGHRHLDSRLSLGLLICSLCIMALGLTSSNGLSAVLLIAVGMSWVFCSNSIMVAAQTQLEATMRGRGLSFVYAAGTAGLAGGGLIWGVIARASSPATALVASGLSLLAILTVTYQLRIASPEDGE